jgi:hypothetical protein
VVARTARQWPAILAAALLSVASVVPMVWLELRPQGGAEVAAIFPPWLGREHAFTRVAAAGGLIVRQGARDWILVVHGDDAGLIDRLYAAGAWAVIDPVAFGGCLARSPDDRSGSG